MDKIFFQMADIETDRIPFLPKISKTSRLRNRLKSLATTTFAYMFCVLMGLAVGVVWTSQQYSKQSLPAYAKKTLANRAS